VCTDLRLDQQWPRLRLAETAGTDIAIVVSTNSEL